MDVTLERLKGLLSGQGPGHLATPDYRIDSEHACVYVNFTGKLTSAEIALYANSLSKHPGFESDWSEIVDLRGVEQFQIMPNETIDLADTIDPFSLSSRRAFVVANEQQRHAARMQQVLRSPCKTIGIFETLEEAERWVRRAPAAGAQVLPFPSRPRP